MKHARQFSEDQSYKVDEAVEFLQQYSNVIELQLSGVQKSMNDAVQKIITSVLKVNVAVNRVRELAEHELHRTHFSSSTEVALESSLVQKHVDQLASDVDDPLSADVQDNQEHLQAQVRTVKATESLGRLADDLSKPLIHLLCLFSVEDALGQRLAHVSQNISVFCHKLALLTGKDSASHTEAIGQFEAELSSTARKIFSTLVEKNVLERSLGTLDLTASTLPSSQHEFLFSVSKFVQVYIDQICDTQRILQKTAAEALVRIQEIAHIVENRRLYAVSSTIPSAQADIDEMVQNLHAVEQEISHTISSLISQLAIEDIVSQRLKNVEHALSFLIEFIKSIVTADMTSERNYFYKSVELLQKLINSYVMASELACFLLVYKDQYELNLKKIAVQS